MPAHGSRRGVSAGPIEVLAFDEHDARTAGEIRAALEAAGTPIGAYDLLIAGQALRRGYTLVTAIVPAFARVPSLSWEDWATPPSDAGSPAEWSVTRDAGALCPQRRQAPGVTVQGSTVDS